MQPETYILFGLSISWSIFLTAQLLITPSCLLKFQASDDIRRLYDVFRSQSTFDPSVFIVHIMIVKGFLNHLLEAARERAGWPIFPTKQLKY